MPAQDLLSLGYGNVTEFKQETNDLVKSLIALKAAAKDVEGTIGNFGNFGAGIKDFKQASDQLAQSQNKLADATDQYNKAALQQAKITKANADAQKAQIAADNEVIKQISLEADAEKKLAASKQATAKASKQKADAQASENIPFTSNLNPDGSIDEPGTQKTSGPVVNDAEIAATQEQLASQIELNAEKQKGIALTTQDETVNAEDAATTKLLADAKEKLAFATSEANVQLKGYALQTEQANAAAKLEAEEALGLSGAYKKLTLDLAAAKVEAKNLAAEFGVESVQAREAAASASALDVKVKAIDKTVGESQRNVGNYSSAFGKAFGSLRQLAAILPGIGLAGLFNLAFDAISKAVTALNLFGFAADNIHTSVKTMQDTLASSNTEFVNAVKNVDLLTINIDLAKKGFIDKDKVVKEYNETIGKTTGQVNNLNEAETELGKNAQAYIQFTLYKAAANLALEESAKKIVEVEQKSLKDAKDYASALADTHVSQQGTFNAAEFDADTKRIEDARNKRKADDIKASQDEADQQTKIATDLQTKAAEIAKKFHFNIFGDADQDAKDAESAAKKRQRELEDAAKKFQDSVKQQFSSLAQFTDELQQQNLDKLSEIAGNENALTGLRIIALKKYEEIKAEQIQRDADNEIALNHTTVAQTLAIRQKAENDIVKLEQDTANKIASIQNKAADDLAKAKLKQDEDFENQIIQIGDETTKKLEQNRKDREDQDKAAAEKAKQLKKDLYDAEKKDAEEAYAFIQELVDANYERSINHIQDEIDANNTKYTQEIQNVQNSTLSKQDQAAEVTRLQAEQNAKNLQLTQQMNKQKEKQAKVDRDAQVLQIVGEAIAAHFKFIAELGPAGLPLAIANDIEAGLEVAFLLAKPLPHYKDELKVDKPDHVGLYGEIPELIQKPGELPFIATTPTIDFLPRGTRITRVDTDGMNEVLHYAMLKRLGQSMQQVKEKTTTQDFDKALDKHANKVVKAIMQSKPILRQRDLRAIGGEMALKNAMNEWKNLGKRN
jgi:hypothetical protein